MDATAEGGPGPAAPPTRRRRKKIAAVLVAFAMIGGGWFTWDFLIRPRTMSEVLEGGPYGPGTTVRVAGPITAIYREETSYGPIVALELEDPSLLPFLSRTANRCGSGSVRGDVATSYNIGDRFETVLHFESYSFNGDPGVWAPELVCWFPGLLRDIGTVIDAVSQTAGIELMYNGTGSGGWSLYEIRTANVTGYDADLLPVDLLKAMPAGMTVDSGARWRDAMSRFYLRVSGALGPYPLDFSVADRMTSLAAASSTNGTLRFMDVDANDRVNGGDRLEVRLPPTDASNAWDTYLLRIGNWSAQETLPPGRGVHVILLGPAGSLEVLRAD